MATTHKTHGQIRSFGRNYCDPHYGTWRYSAGKVIFFQFFQIKINKNLINQKMCFYAEM